MAKNKRVLIIQGHPLKDSFCGALASSYEKGAKDAGATVRRIDLGEIKFNPLLKYAYRKRMELEPDLVKAQEDIRWADHLVILFPTWWGTFPALFKGFFDRIWLPNLAFKFKGNKTYFYERKLKGKSGRIIVCMDGSPLMYRFIWHSPGASAVKWAILKFSGVSPVRKTYIGYIKMLGDRGHKWQLNRVYRIGRRVR